MQFVRCANNTLLSLAYNRFADKMLDVFGELMNLSLSCSAMALSVRFWAVDARFWAAGAVHDGS
jgi:hypothetical protein